MAGCLGDPLAAAILDPLSATKSVPNGISEVGIAASGMAASVPTETLCVATTSAAAATTLAAQIKRAFSAGVIEDNDQTWADRLKNPVVTVVGGPAHLVRLTAQPTPLPIAGVLFDANLATLLVARP